LPIHPVSAAARQPVGTAMPYAIIPRQCEKCGPRLARCAQRRPIGNRRSNGVRAGLPPDVPLARRISRRLPRWLRVKFSRRSTPQPKARSVQDSGRRHRDAAPSLRPIRHDSLINQQSPHLRLSTFVRSASHVPRFAPPSRSAQRSRLRAAHRVVAASVRTPCTCALAPTGNSAPGGRQPVHRTRDESLRA
jgi:hypothetical protein